LEKKEKGKSSGHGETNGSTNEEVEPLGHLEKNEKGKSSRHGETSGKNSKKFLSRLQI
jgi:hypothetical protein